MVAVTVLPLVQFPPPVAMLMILGGLPRVKPPSSAPISGVEPFLESPSKSTVTPVPVVALPSQGLVERRCRLIADWLPDGVIYCGSALMLFASGPAPCPFHVLNVKLLEPLAPTTPLTLLVPSVYKSLKLLV